jgi:hypothetical protein
MPVGSLTFRDLMRELGPSVSEGTPPWNQVMTLTRTTTRGSQATTTVSRRITRPGFMQTDLLEPGQLGLRTEGGAVWGRTTSTEWVELPPAEAPTKVAPLPQVPLPTIKRLNGDRVLRVIFPEQQGTHLEWDVDWLRKVITGQRLVRSDGAVVWDDDWQEVRASGWRWLLRRVRKEHLPGAGRVEETVEWSPAPGAATSPMP